MEDLPVREQGGVDEAHGKTAEKEAPSQVPRRRVKILSEALEPHGIGAARQDSFKRAGIQSLQAQEHDRARDQKEKAQAGPGLFHCAADHCIFR